MSTLHIIPKFVVENTFHGAYKDVLFRTQWLEQHVPGYRQAYIREDDPACLTGLLAEVRPSHVLIEYTLFPNITRAVRAVLPDAWIVVRAHNLEPLQHLDNFGWWPQRGPLWMIYGVVRLWVQDMTVKRIADTILSINEWENHVYWNLLPGRAIVDWLPYICPEHLLPRAPLPYPERRVIACLPTSHENRKSLDMVLRFMQFAREMKLQGCEDNFVLTGDLSQWSLPDCPEVTRTGFVDDLGNFMGHCKAVCMLSALGYGFKTTITDALAAGAHMIVHPSLARRSPRILQPYLCELDGSSAAAVAALAEQLRVAPDAVTLHKQFLRQALEIMEHCFGSESLGRCVRSARHTLNHSWIKG